MGHSGTEMLMKVYAHQTPENTVKAQAAVSEVLFGEQEVPCTAFRQRQKKGLTKVLLHSSQVFYSSILLILKYSLKPFAHVLPIFLHEKEKGQSI